MRVVLDSNVILSAILFGGKPRQVLEAALSGEIKMYVSEAILTELKGVFQRPKFGLSSEIIEAITSELASTAEWVHPTKHLAAIKDDPSDNEVIDCALEANADYIVSGDRHLLELGKCGSVSILNPDEFLALLKKKE